jgi:hypothetical protein
MPPFLDHGMADWIHDGSHGEPSSTAFPSSIIIIIPHQQHMRCTTEYMYIGQT